MKKAIITAIVTFGIGCINAQTVADYDGNIYNTVTINNSIWMAENLRVTHFNNGDLIPNITNNSNWSSLTTPALGYYDNDSSTYAGDYGALYNGFTVADTRNVCPVNWHVATDSDWNQMTYFIDSLVDTTVSEVYTGGTIGKKLKHIDHNYWFWSNAFYQGTDDYGFSALPGGARSSAGGTYADLNYFGDWWTADTIAGGGGYIRFLYAEESRITKSQRNLKNGYSIRCVMDAEAMGIDNGKKTMGLNIFPIPATDILYFTDQTIVAQVEVHNLMGQKIKTLRNVSFINISELKPGFYLLQMKQEGRTIIQKFIKE